MKVNSVTCAAARRVGASVQCSCPGGRVSACRAAAQAGACQRAVQLPSRWQGVCGRQGAAGVAAAVAQRSAGGTHGCSACRRRWSGHGPSGAAQHAGSGRRAPTCKFFSVGSAAALGVLPMSGWYSAVPAGGRRMGRGGAVMRGGGGHGCCGVGVCSTSAAIPTVAGSGSRVRGSGVRKRRRPQQAPRSTAGPSVHAPSNSRPTWYQP